MTIVPIPPLVSYLITLASIAPISYLTTPRIFPNTPPPATITPKSTTPTYTPLGLPTSFAPSTPTTPLAPSVELTPTLRRQSSRTTYSKGPVRFVEEYPGEIRKRGNYNGIVVEQIY